MKTKLAVLSSITTMTLVLAFALSQSTPHSTGAIHKLTATEIFV